MLSPVRPLSPKEKPMSSRTARKLLLFLGIAMPTVLYIVWGVMEIVGIPVAK